MGGEYATLVGWRLMAPKLELKECGRSALVFINTPHKTFQAGARSRKDFGKPHTRVAANSPSPFRGRGPALVGR